MSTQTRSDVIENMAAVSDQVRKTTQATTEQVRQTMSAAQEQVQQSITRAQQAQNDAARLAARWYEQNCLLANAAFAAYWDTSVSLLKTAAWGVEQNERLTLHTVEQSRLTREEGTRLVCEVAEQMQRQHCELIRLGQESIRASLFYAGRAARKEGEPAR